MNVGGKERYKLQTVLLLLLSCLRKFAIVGEVSIGLSRDYLVYGVVC